MPPAHPPTTRLESSPPSPGARRVADIAHGICIATAESPFDIEVGGERYSYYASQFGVVAPCNGWLRAPGGAAYRLKPGYDYWKCNILGGTVIALAHLPVPTFRVGKQRHFPLAERFGEALARKPGWTLVKTLDHRSLDNPLVAATSAEHDVEIRDLLLSAAPGDLLFVDHPGQPGDNGGHTRVCVEAADPASADAAPLFAQAREDAAHELLDGMMRLGAGRELRFWLCRYVE